MVRGGCPPGPPPPSRVTRGLFFVESPISCQTAPDKKISISLHCPFSTFPVRCAREVELKIHRIINQRVEWWCLITTIAPPPAIGFELREFSSPRPPRPVSSSHTTPPLSETRTRLLAAGAETFVTTMDVIESVRGHRRVAVSSRASSPVTRLRHHSQCPSSRIFTRKDYLA